MSALPNGENRGSTYPTRQPKIPIAHNTEYHTTPTTASMREVVMDESLPFSMWYNGQ